MRQVAFFLQSRRAPQTGSTRHKAMLPARLSPRPVRWAALCPLKGLDVLTPAPMNLSLLGNKVFADVIRVRGGHAGLGRAPREGFLLVSRVSAALGHPVSDCHLGSCERDFHCFVSHAVVVVCHRSPKQPEAQSLPSLRATGEAAR